METGTLDTTQQTIGLLRDAAHAMKSVTTSPLDEVKAVHAAKAALEAREADLLAQIDQTKAHEDDGAATISTWAARELHQDTRTTKQLIRAAKTMTEMPLIGAAAHAGAVNIDHVHAFTFALKHVGYEQTLAVEDQFLVLASHMTPRDLFDQVRICQAIAHPDELDKAWLKGMELQDFRLLKTADGYVPSGFLPIDVGAKLKVYLDAKSVPTGPDDDRTAAERRVDAIDELATNAVGSGDLPTQNSVRPHVSVIVDAPTLKDALSQTVVEVGARQGDPRNHDLLDSEPAILEGFGPIGPALLAYIAFGGELTPIMVAGFKKNRKVLDVGRTSRVATKKQRKAIHYRQQGRCANRGCHHPIGEVHHPPSTSCRGYPHLDWLYGGATKLSNMVGLCRKCHALITMGRLHMSGTFETGYTFTPSRAGPLARAG